MAGQAAWRRGKWGVEYELNTDRQERQGRQKKRAAGRRESEQDKVERLVKA